MLAKVRSAQKTRIANGHTFGRDVDRRMPGARRFVELIAGYTAQLGTPPTATQIQAIRNVAAHDLTLESLQADAAAGRPVDPTALVRLSGSRRRELQAAGLGGPTPDEPERDLMAAATCNFDDVTIVAPLAIYDEVKAEAEWRKEYAERPRTPKPEVAE